MGEGAQIALQGPGVGRQPAVPARQAQGVGDHPLQVSPAGGARAGLSLLTCVFSASPDDCGSRGVGACGASSAP